MSRDQCIERSERCLAIAQDHRTVTARKVYMQRASWLWLFVWSGMFW